MTMITDHGRNSIQNIPNRRKGPKQKHTSSSHIRHTWHILVFGPLLLTLPVTPYAVTQLHEREGQVQTQEEKQIARGFIGKN